MKIDDMDYKESLWWASLCFSIPSIVISIIVILLK